MDNNGYILTITTDCGEVFHRFFHDFSNLTKYVVENNGAEHEEDITESLNWYSHWRNETNGMDYASDTIDYED